MNVDTLDCTSGMRHCGFSPPRMTGVKMRLGSEAARSAKYLLQTRSMILRGQSTLRLASETSDIQVQFGYQRPSKGEGEQGIWSQEPQDLDVRVSTLFARVPAAVLRCTTYRRPSPWWDIIEVFPADPTFRPLPGQSVCIILSGAGAEQTRLFRRILASVVIWLVHAVSAAGYGAHGGRRRRRGGYVVVRHGVCVTSDSVRLDVELPWNSVSRNFSENWSRQLSFEGTPRYRWHSRYHFLPVSYRTTRLSRDSAGTLVAFRSRRRGSSKLNSCPGSKSDAVQGR